MIGRMRKRKMTKYREWSGGSNLFWFSFPKELTSILQNGEVKT